MVDHIQIGNHRLNVVSPDEAEQAQFCVCGPADTPTPWTDDIHTTCGMCGAAIIHRPHAPAAPMKICIGCALSLPKEGEGLN